MAEKRWRTVQDTDVTWLCANFRHILWVVWEQNCSETCPTVVHIHIYTCSYDVNVTQVVILFLKCLMIVTSPWHNNLLARGKVSSEGGQAVVGHFHSLHFCRCSTAAPPPSTCKAAARLSACDEASLWLKVVFLQLSRSLTSVVMQGLWFGNGNNMVDVKVHEVCSDTDTHVMMLMIHHVIRKKESLSGSLRASQQTCCRRKEYNRSPVTPIKYQVKVNSAAKVGKIGSFACSRKEKHAAHEDVKQQWRLKELHSAEWFSLKNPISVDNSWIFMVITARSQLRFRKLDFSVYRHV